MDHASALPSCDWETPATELEAALVALADARAHIQRLEQTCRSLVDAASDAFVAIDGTGTIVDWNAQAERTFGWSRHEVIGRDVDATLVPPLTRGERLGALVRAVVGVNGGPSELRGELWALHRHGHDFPVEVVLQRATQGEDQVVYAYIHDLTRLRNGEEECRRLAAMVESCEDAIIGTGIDGRIVTWNRGAERLYGYCIDEVAGEPVCMLVPAEHYEDLAVTADRVRQGEPVRQHETKGLRKNGVVLEVSVTISPICDEAGVPTGLSIVARDVTEQRWMASTLSATLESFEKALDEARESEARYRRFTADAAHQLRTPIAGIRACAESLLRDPTPEDKEALLADVVRETARATRLMSSLLQMSRLDQGRTLVPVPCDIVQLASSELDRARAIAPNLELSLRVVGAPAGRAEVDTHAVKEILANLLDNARRHASTSVRMELDFSPDQVELRVLDDGEGVSEGMEQRIFERFVSLDGKGGSGLGLPIGRALARAHGGELAYEEEGFVLRLPMKAQIHCGGAGDPDFGHFEEPTEWEARAVP